jgi:hypothetical protein
MREWKGKMVMAALAEREAARLWPCLRLSIWTCLCFLFFFRSSFRCELLSSFTFSPQPLHFWGVQLDALFPAVLPFVSCAISSPRPALFELLFTSYSNRSNVHSIERHNACDSGVGSDGRGCGRQCYSYYLGKGVQVLHQRW